MSATAAVARRRPAWRSLGGQILLAMVLGIALEFGHEETADADPAGE